VSTETSTQQRWCPCCEAWIDVPAPTEHAFEDGETRGDLTMTSLFDDGELVGVRVERADLVVSIGVDLAAGPLAPGITFDGTTLRIEATNGTWTYLVHEGGLATLIEDPAVTG
jgi:hypothetical protein